MIIGGALVVLVLAVLMIVRELARGTTKPGAPARDLAKTSSPPASVPPPRSSATDDEDVDVTRIGGHPSGTLPRLGLEAGYDPQDAPSDSTAMTVFEDGAEVDEPTGPIDLLFLSAAAQSDVGRKRKRNEDAFLLDDERSLFIVADGMGGYAGGDIASQLATKTIVEFLGEDRHAMPVVGRPERPWAANELVASIQAANAAVYRAAEESADLHGMGTTVVAASFTPRKRRGYIAYVGDSRCYRLRNRELKLLTLDHTFAAKGIGGPIGEQIRRAVGVRPSIKVDLIVDSPREGDVYLLCSDGLNKMLAHEELQALVIEHRDDLPACARSLVRRANEAGGRDNVTVVVVRVKEADASLVSSSSRSQPLQG